MLPPQVRGLPAVLRLSDDAHARLLIDDGNQAVTDDGVVFRNQDADRR